MSGICTCDACIANGLVPKAVVDEIRASDARAAEARRTKPLAPAPAQKAGTTMRTWTPDASDIAWMHEIDRRRRLLQSAEPGLSDRAAIDRASKQLSRGQGIEDPGHRILHEMASRYELAHHVGYAKALAAVGAEYEKLVAGAPPASPAGRAAAAAADEPRDLDRAARRRMAEERSLSYKEALLLEDAARHGAATGKKPSALAPGLTGTVEDADEEPSEADVFAYMRKHDDLTYKEALRAVQLERSGAVDVAQPKAAAVREPTAAQIRAHADRRGIKASQALVELTAAPASED